jgi:hypothetical protein
MTGFYDSTRIPRRHPRWTAKSSHGRSGPHSVRAVQPRATDERQYSKRRASSVGTMTRRRSATSRLRGGNVGLNLAGSCREVFGQPTPSGIGQGLDTAPRRWAQKLSDQMVGYWTEFAKSSNPNGRGQPVWRPFSPPVVSAPVLDPQQIVYLGTAAPRAKSFCPVA